MTSLNTDWTKTGIKLVFVYVTNNLDLYLVYESFMHLFLEFLINILFFNHIAIQIIY